LEGRWIGVYKLSNFVKRGVRVVVLIKSFLPVEAEISVTKV